jgi:hypothetical protein
MANAAKPKPSTRKILTPLDDQLDDSFPASDPPSLTDPSKSVVTNDPVATDGDDAPADADKKR